MATKIHNRVGVRRLALKPGDRVHYEHDDNSVSVHRVRTAPFQAGGTWVIWLQGISGFVALCRVRPIRIRSRRGDEELLANILGLLKDLEWSGIQVLSEGDHATACPACGAIHDEAYQILRDHEPDCRLRAAISLLEARLGA